MAVTNEKNFAVQLKDNNNKSIPNDKTTNNIANNSTKVGNNKLTSHNNKKKITQVADNIMINNNRKITKINGISIDTNNEKCKIKLKILLKRKKKTTNLAMIQSTLDNSM